MNIKKKRAVAYCRVSTDKYDQKNSLENQKDYFEDSIKKHKDWDLIEIYADEGISGTSLKKRNEFNRMIHDAYKGKFDLILTKEVSRFARNTVDALNATRELKEIGIEVKFIIDNISTFDSEGEFKLSLMASIAQDESRRISERTKFGIQQRMKNGMAFGNYVYGYDFETDKETGKKTKLVINQEEAKVVKYIFNAYLYEGKGAHTIAKELKEKGIPVKRPIKKDISTNWRDGTILGILKNEKYIGDLRQQKTFIPNYLNHKPKKNEGEVESVYIKNHHEAIISREDYELVQKELKRRSELYKNSKSKYSNKHTFSGKLRCGICGEPYVANYRKKDKSGNNVFKAWRCSTAVQYGLVHTTDEGLEVGCNNNLANDEALKAGFKEVMKSIKIDKQKIKKDIIKELKNELNKCEDESQITSLEKKRREIESEGKILLDLCLKKIISQEEYKDKREELEKELNQIDELIKKEEHVKLLRTSIEEVIENATMVIDEILNVKKFSKKVCREVLDSVVIYSKTKYAYFFKGKTAPIFFNSEDNISYSQG